MDGFDHTLDLSFLPDLCEKIFARDGYASILPNFEHRPEQEKMAYCAAQAFASDSPILFEAGTGVGKSLAYLVPGIIAAVRSGRQLVVATHTIALQQQIVKKDLERVRALFSNRDALADCAGFKSAILVGRSNYLCSHRLKRALAERRELFDSEESRELDRIADWAISTKTGLVEELNPPPNPEVWAWVNADSSSCTPRNCSDGTCFYQNARKNAAQADVVILNHSLLFSLLASGLGTESDERGVLFPNDFLVMDEAHLAPDTASEAFGISLSGGGALRILRRIYDPRKKRGLITRGGMAEYVDKQKVCEAISTCETFFANIRKDMLAESDTVRLHSPDWNDGEILLKLDALARLLDSFAQNAKDEKLSAEIKDLRKSVVGMHNSIEDCLSLGDRDSVYWLERCGRGNCDARINSAPVDVSKILRRAIFDRGVGVLMTSATLAVNGDMSPFSERIGAEGAENFICSSPFDYDRQMSALLCVNAPEPDAETKKLDPECIGKSVEKFSAEWDGGTLVLFTNRSDMKGTADFLRNSSPLKEREIFVQGELGRSEITKRFSDAGNAILLGTDTFWTGIDVPGPALSQVIITRLPFDNFRHPLIEARMERVEADGESSFQKISLPNAIIKFRQGIGRLIRNSSDEGRIVILDSRIASKPYGKKFVAAIPTAKITRISLK